MLEDAVLVLCTILEIFWILTKFPIAIYHASGHFPQLSSCYLFVGRQISSVLTYHIIQKIYLLQKYHNMNFTTISTHLLLYPLSPLPCSVSSPKPVGCTVLGNIIVLLDSPYHLMYYNCLFMHLFLWLISYERAYL